MNAAIGPRMYLVSKLLLFYLEHHEYGLRGGTVDEAIERAVTTADRVLSRMSHEPVSEIDIRTKRS